MTAPQSARRPLRQRLRQRRGVLLGGLALVAALVVGLVVVLERQGDQDCRVTEAGAPTCGAWWGSALNSVNSKLPAAVAAREKSSGRRLDIVHAYHRWTETFPTAAETTLADKGRLVFLNWEPVASDGQNLSWQDIADGRYDEVIRAAAARLAALDRTVLVSFSHEPELSFKEHGDAASFAAAFRHVVTLSRTAGATNVKWVWNVMGLSDPVWRERYPQMWPGNDYVDWVGWDPYNFASCRDKPWRTFAETVQPFYSWLVDHGFGDKPFMLAEFGTIEGADKTTGKAKWLQAIPDAMADLPNLRALVYFDLPHPPANCNWILNTSPAAQSAYAEVAKSDVFAWPRTQAPTRRT